MPGDNTGFVDRRRKNGRFLVIVERDLERSMSVESMLSSNTPPAFSLSAGKTSASTFNVNDGKRFLVVVFVTMPDADTVVVDAVLNTDSTPLCMPAKMPSWADAGSATRASDPIATSAHAAGPRRNYFSPMTATQYGPSPTSISATTFRSARLPTIKLRVSGLTMYNLLFSTSMVRCDTPLRVLME